MTVLSGYFAGLLTCEWANLFKLLLFCFSDESFPHFRLLQCMSHNILLLVLHVSYLSLPFCDSFSIIALIFLKLSSAIISVQITQLYTCYCCTSALNGGGKYVDVFGWHLPLGGVVARLTRGYIFSIRSLCCRSVAANRWKCSRTLPLRQRRR
jgi:hypothetical protein